MSASGSGAVSASGSGGGCLQADVPTLLGRHIHPTRPTPQADTSPPRQPLQRTVRILLERILVFVVSGCSALLFSLIYPLRMVQKMELLKGGSLLRITTYGNLTRSKQHSVSMDKISCAVNRQNANPYVKVKVSDNRLLFMLDNKVGTFHEPELFDRIIGSIKSTPDIRSTSKKRKR